MELLAVLVQFLAFCSTNACIVSISCFLEACGYMARVAFIMDRIFRKFGLSGKSFIPILIGTGCGVPGIMASRTIENDRDRKMTIMTTTFIPCGAKSSYYNINYNGFIQWCMVGCSKCLYHWYGSYYYIRYYLKKTKMFAGEPAPFCYGASSLPFTYSEAMC